MPPNEPPPDASVLAKAGQDDLPKHQPTTIAHQGVETRNGSGSTIANAPTSDEEARGEAPFQKPRRTAGYWDPRMANIRKQVAWEWFRILVYLLFFIIGVLSLFWAVLSHVESNLSKLAVYIVDFDAQVTPFEGVTPLVGPAMRAAAQRLVDNAAAGGPPALGFVSVPPSRYDFDPIAVRRGVYDWDAWAAVIIHANATALLQEAVATGNASYDPTGAVQFIVQSARHETTFSNYFTPQLQALAREFAADFGPTWARIVMANESVSRDTLALAPAALTPAVAPLTIDLRPFLPAAASPSVSIGLIYLIIVAFFSFAFFLPIHMKLIIPQGHPPLRFWQLIVWRLFATIMTYFSVSLVYSFVSLAFQIPFSTGPASPTEPAFNATAYGRGSFVVYWMVNFIGMNALGIACENVGMMIGQPWTAAWLIFWVITNVSAAFYSLDLAPGFFRWGYAWPLHHIVQASRQILFDLHSQIGLNFGVLFAWTAVNIALFPFCCYFLRWKQQRLQRQAANAKQGGQGQGEKSGEQPSAIKRWLRFGRGG
ncbi:hypothetical protein GGS23DRAFT_101126 [Durotheca rogersii]|uniref:uncharacterized protein n=1 Tax=Durotheca rogersii TaxID=419775 RepID=UPI00221EB42D|nr:uncharacterized protein GGS23DRAFT_101126 [Durotheca rogersii]KAI5862455.1 hypothetical protein GGS23DRAFT_101126 [Durotheca rogersii]